MKNNKIHYTYITTNRINGKQYVGDHSTHNLNDGYLGSGTILIQAVKKYGKEKFKRDILEQCNTKQEAFDLQEKYIREFNTLAPNGYNLSPKGGHQATLPMSYETKLKIGKASKGRQTWLNRKHSDDSKNKISNSLKGNIPWNKNKRNIYSEETLKKNK